MRPCRVCGIDAGKGRQYCVPCFTQRRAEKEKARKTSPCAQCGGPSRKRSITGLCKPCLSLSQRTLIPCPRCGVEFWPWANGKNPRKRCGSCKPQPRPPKPAPSQRFCVVCDCEIVGPNATQRLLCYKPECRAQRSRETSRQWGRANKTKAVAKARRNKEKAKSQNPERYASMARKHLKDSNERIKRNHPKKYAARIVGRVHSKWINRWRKRFGGNIPDDVMELLNGNRELVRDLQMNSAKWRAYLETRPWTPYRG